MVGATEEQLLAQIPPPARVGGQTAVRQTRLVLTAIDTIAQQGLGDGVPCRVGTVGMEVKRYPSMPLEAERRLAEVTGRDVAHAPDVILQRHRFGSASPGLRGHVLEGATLGE